MKESKRTFIFPTVARMYELLGEDVIGLTINSLYNALAKASGEYENNRVIVAYKPKAKAIVV